MEILVYANMNERGKQNPKKRKVSANAVYFPKSDQASISGECKMYFMFIVLIYLAQCVENGTEIKMQLKQNT